MNNLLEKKIINKRPRLCKLNFTSNKEFPFVVKKVDRPTVYKINIKSAVRATILFEGISKIKIEAVVNKDAELNLTTLILDTNKVDLDSEIKLGGMGARVNQNIMVLSNKEENIRVNCVLNHLAPYTYGRIVSRRAQAGGSMGLLYAMLKIAPGAFGTDTYLSDKVILIGDKARAESIPSLEILADNVKASHGTTIGKISADELFYLRSRGLDLFQARTLLLQAFIRPVLVGVDVKTVERAIKKLSKLQLNN